MLTQKQQLLLIACLWVVELIAQIEALSGVY